jgi:DNA-binding winged helix-turn-helix (wHTH) protein/TolB-like protein
MVPTPTPFRLRDRTVTPDRNMIAGPDGEAGIEPKIMQVLCVLASEPGRVFSRAELIDKVWGTEFGADESLTRAISLLRKALGDTRSEPAMIETIAKRGYRLLPSALAVDAPPVPQANRPLLASRRVWLAGGGAAVAALALVWWLKPGTDTGIPVIVLPVNAVRKESSQTSLAAALTVDLVGLLAKEKRFHVTVRDPDPATRNRRRYSIYADLQTAEGQVRTHVEIMDLDTGQALWSRLYEQPYDGKLSSQSKLSAAITRDLTAALLAQAAAKP